MLNRSEYDPAVKRYGWTVVWGMIVAFALFDLILGLIELALFLAGDAVRLWLRSLSSIEKVLTVLPIVLVPGPLALLFLVHFVRRARRKPVLYCPECNGFIGEPAIARTIWRVGTCPRCSAEVLSQSELDIERNSRSQIPAALMFAAIGIGLLIYGIGKPLAMQIVLAVAGLVNFGGAVRLVVTNRRRDDNGGVQRNNVY